MARLRRSGLVLRREEVGVVETSKGNVCRKNEKDVIESNTKRAGVSVGGLRETEWKLRPTPKTVVREGGGEKKRTRNAVRQKRLYTRNLRLYNSPAGG